jgi:CRISPR-associated protein Cas5 subtype I-B
VKAVRFRVEGVLNSFRIPLFKKYHKTFLAPPKTVVLGMVSNIMGESEEFYYNLLNSDISVSVVIEDIDGKTKDLWRYRTDKGTSIIRRDRLFKPQYIIYIHSEDLELLNKIENSLRFPKSIPSLGLDDELVNIADIKTVELVQNGSKEIDSIFMESGEKFNIAVGDGYMIANSGEVPLSFKVEFDKKGNRKNREALNRVNQMEYLGCKVEIDGDSWSDGKYRIQLY